MKFAAGCGHLISIGAVDKTIFQWKFNKDRVAAVANYELFVDELLKPDVLTPPHPSPLIKTTIGGESEMVSKQMAGESEVEESGRRRKLISDIVHSKPKDYKVSRTAVRVE